MTRFIKYLVMKWRVAFELDNHKIYAYMIVNDSDRSFYMEHFLKD